jgi:hypothetical protein
MSADHLESGNSGYVKEPLTLEYGAMLARVKAEPWRLPHIASPPEDFYIEVVAHDGMALQYVLEKTVAIVEAAVTQNGLALQFVPERFKIPRIEAIAMAQNIASHRFAKNQEESLSLMMVKADWEYLEHVRVQTQEIAYAAFRGSVYALELIAPEFQTNEMCLAAVTHDPKLLSSVANQTEEICIAAVSQHGLLLKDVKLQTEAICLAAVKQRGSALRYVQAQTKSVCNAAVRQDLSAAKHIRLNANGVPLGDALEAGLPIRRRLLTEVGYSFLRWPGVSDGRWEMRPPGGYRSQRFSHVKYAVDAAWGHALMRVKLLSSRDKPTLGASNDPKKQAADIERALHPRSRTVLALQAIRLLENGTALHGICDLFDLSPSGARELIALGDQENCRRHFGDVRILRHLDLSDIALPVASATVDEPEAAEEFSPSP